MPNKLQKSIWIITGGIPFLFILSVVYYFTYYNRWVLGSCTVLMTLSYIVFSKMFNNHLELLPTQQIEVSGIAERDGRVCTYILTYISPLASIVFKSYNIQISIAIAFFAFFILLCTNVMTFNPFLLIKGYHYYEASTTNGVQNYTIISKRKLKKNISLTEVKMLTDYFLLDNWR